MHFNQVREIVRRAVERLLHDDASLFQDDVREEAIVHQLANYLGQHFTGWNIDCEYNRNQGTIKQLSYERFGDNRMRNVVPDIIVHHRGTPDNLLAMEIKKSTNPEADEVDIAKVEALHAQLGYTATVFLRFVAGTQDVGVKTEHWAGGT